VSRAGAKLARRKDKREKKLMRAGFEGRRDTFINAWPGAARVPGRELQPL